MVNSLIRRAVWDALCRAWGEVSMQDVISYRTLPIRGVGIVHHVSQASRIVGGAHLTRLAADSIVDRYRLHCRLALLRERAGFHV